jgi:hypothetical protein
MPDILISIAFIIMSSIVGSLVYYESEMPFRNMPDEAKDLVKKVANINRGSLFFWGIISGGLCAWFGLSVWTVLFAILFWAVYDLHVYSCREVLRRHKRWEER